MNPSEALRPGHLLRDFLLPGNAGTLAQFRRRSAMVLLFGSHPELVPLLAEVAAIRERFSATETKLLAIVRADSPPPAADAPFFPVLHDDGQTLRALQAQNSATDPGNAVLLTDRFGEIFLAAVTSRGDQLPSADELARTAEFVQIQCEECHPPEWPVL